MKKIFALILSAGLVAGIGMILYSCSPTQPYEQESVQLLSAPPSLNLTRADSSKQSAVGLSCGCNFDSLIATGYGGNTNVIHFSFKESLTDFVTTHTVYASISPSELTSSGADTAWIALFHRQQDGSNALLYDTIYATANY